MLCIEEKFPEKRTKPNRLGLFQVNFFNVVMDTAVTSFADQFNRETLEIMQDLSLLDPRSFPAIAKNIKRIDGSIDKFAEAF